MKHKCDGCKYKGEHQEMMFKPFGLCLKESNLVEAEKVYKAEKCPFKKTYFEGLKEFNIEQMVDFLSLITTHDKNYIKEWLESEVSDDE